MKLVVDASVAVKWVLRDQPNEPHADRASALLGAITRRTVHSRFGTVVRRTTYRRASELSKVLNHHLFDTLYHAVALEEGATLVTADEEYFNKAKGLGQFNCFATSKPHECPQCGGDVR